MNKLAKSPSTIIGLIVIVLLGLAYFFFFSSPETPALSATNVASSAAEQSFAALVTQLAPITFNLKVFSDARFASLTDLSTPIAPEPSGRTDPFAPVSGTKGAGQ